MTKEMREGIVALFDAMSTWRNEISTANERCLGKALDRIIRDCALDGMA
jgi:hypothetical protein